jgi:hypothetical protein
LLLLTADKGEFREEALLGQRGPDLTVHGSFSLPVNYHALGQVVSGGGGQVLNPDWLPHHLAIIAVLLGRPPGDFLGTRLAFETAVNQASPDVFFVLKKGLEPVYPDLKLEELLAYLRLSGWDANILLKSFPVWLERLVSISGSLEEEVRRGLWEVWDGYFPIGEQPDLAFHIGWLMSIMGHQRDALEFFDHSLRLYGPAPETHYRRALCYAALGRLDEAEWELRHALERDPTFGPARALRLRLDAERRADGGEGLGFGPDPADCPP